MPCCHLLPWQLYLSVDSCCYMLSRGFTILCCIVPMCFEYIQRGSHPR